MGDKLEQLYEGFLKGQLLFQKKMERFCLEKMIIITGTTGAGKSTLIHQLHLPHLVSYKTGDMGTGTRPGQLYIAPEKFEKKLEKGDFFDIYRLENKYYAYALRDYFVLQKEYNKVFIEVSLENLARGIQYIPKSIVILSPSNTQLESNLKKRATERMYDEKKQEEVATRQKHEISMIESIKSKYNNCYSISSFSELEFVVK